MLCEIRNCVSSVPLCICSMMYDEVDIQSAVEFHPVLHSTNIHCVFTIQQSLQQVLYMYHLIPPLLITLPDICLRSQNKPEFKFRSDSHFRAFHLCLRYFSIAVIGHHVSEFTGACLQFRKVSP